MEGHSRKEAADSEDANGIVNGFLRPLRLMPRHSTPDLRLTDRPEAPGTRATTKPSPVHGLTALRGAIASLGQIWLKQFPAPLAALL